MAVVLRGRYFIKLYVSNPRNQDTAIRRCYYEVLWRMIEPTSSRVAFFGQVTLRTSNCLLAQMDKHGRRCGPNSLIIRPTPKMA